MYKAIASPALVTALGRVGLIGFLGAGGLRPQDLESAIAWVRSDLTPGDPYGVNLVASPLQPELELATARILIRHGVPAIEAGGFTRITPALVLLRLKGATQREDGRVVTARKLVAKISRVEVASLFMQPPPPALVAKMRDSGELSVNEARLASSVVMADDVCVEADSGGHTDQGVAYTVLPAVQALRERMAVSCPMTAGLRIGAAGGIGTPEAAAAAFMLGADFIVTGSINQCTLEADTSDAAKDVLEAVDIGDTTYAPAGDMFELGSRVQVVRRGSFFAARANRLYELYRTHASLDALAHATRAEVEGFMGRPLEAVWAETREFYAARDAARLAQIECDGKQKMAAVFKWYFVHTARLARSGAPETRADFQIHCGPALGAFNRWVKGTRLEPWRNRSVADIGVRLMHATADVLNRRFERLLSNAVGARPGQPPMNIVANR
jgi:trans-AT polyketide synthase/acyltransferase/oxidoreductase domain-containing protein